MQMCEATLTEWQGVAVCEVCDWNENGSDGPHGTDYASLAGEYEMYGCPDCKGYCGEWGCGKVVANTPSEDNSDRRTAEMVDDPTHDHVDFVPAADLCPQCDGETVEIRVNGTFLHLMCADPENCHEPEPARCHHGIDFGQCVTCTGKRDPFASYRKADGEGRYVKPYAQLSLTVRGGFGIGQVRDVVPSVETATRQWPTAESSPDWCAETPTVERAPATTHERPTGVPMWYQVYVRGVTPTWPDPERFNAKVSTAHEVELRNAGPVDRPTPGPYIRGLIMRLT